MASQPVEWVLVVYYGVSAHRAIYGRLDGKDTKYTKDYIQLSRKESFLNLLNHLFPDAKEKGLEPLTYMWPTGAAAGALVLRSSDRPHLKWETRDGAPAAWKMSLITSEETSETIPGDPSHRDFSAAERELELLTSRGAGQPYLMAVKLQGQSRILHLRAYLAKPNEDHAWADIQAAPLDIQALAEQTSRRSALAWSGFQSGGIAPSVSVNSILSQLASSDFLTVVETLDETEGHELIKYFQRPGHGLFFDPNRNHDAWLLPAPIPEELAGSIDDFVKILEARFPLLSRSADAVAEKIDASVEEVDLFSKQIEQKNYEVGDSHATVKTRGSAQKAFAEVVKANYEFRCAITGIETKSFLVASHIVPWSEDHSIRLDPSNGICLSLLVDRAFELGYLLVEDDLTIRIHWDMLGDDQVLREQLERYDGQKLSTPRKEEPKQDYLRRRRQLVLRV